MSTEGPCGTLITPRRVAREGERELWALSEGPGARTEYEEEEVRGVRSRGAGLRPQGSLGFYSEKGNHWRVLRRGGTGSNLGLIRCLWLSCPE